MHRGAITLFELLLVLALIVLVFGLAWPAIEGSFAVSELRAAADQVRAAMDDARLEAMRTGMPHLFRYEPSTARYSIAEWNWNATADAEDSMNESADVPAEVNTKDLPEGIVFLTGEVASDARAASYAVGPSEGHVESGDQKSIIFHPDGTASDGMVILKSERGLVIRVVVRGLTGIARASETMSLRELLDEGP